MEKDMEEIKTLSLFLGDFDESETNLWLTIQKKQLPGLSS